MELFNNKYKRGEEIKKQSMMLLNLSPEDENVFSKFPIQAISQKKLNKISGVDFDSPGYTDGSGKKTNIYIRDSFPYIPKLGYENNDKLPAYITEKDVVAHEIGHAKDLDTFGLTNDPSAIRFENRIVGGVPSASSI